MSAPVTAGAAGASGGAPAWTAGATRAFWIGLLVLAFLAALSRFQPVADPDTPWHLTAAEDVLAAGAWTYADDTSFTVPGKEYTSYPWLGDLILLAFYRAAGWSGLTIYSMLAAIASTIFCGLVALRASRGRVWLALGATALVVAAVNFTLEPRPQAMFMAFTPLGLLLAEDFARATDKRALIRATIGLAVLQLVWTHVHSSSILLPAITAFALFEARGIVRSLPRAWIGAVLVFILITGPGGISYFFWVHEVASGDATKHIAEMKPMELAQLYPTHFNSVLWLDLLLGLGAVRAIRRGRVRPADLLRVLFGIILAFTSRRFRAPWAILSIPFAARDEEGAAAPSELRARLERLAAIAAIVLILPLNIKNGIERDPGRGFGFGVDRDAFATDAVAVISGAKLQGNLLNWYDDGGYLTLALGKSVKIAIDGRTPTLFDSELYFWWRAAMSDQPGLADYIATFKPDMALVYRTFPVCRRLATSSDWRPIFADEQRTFFVKTGFADTLPSFSAIHPCDPDRTVSAICARGEETIAAAREELDRAIALAGGEAPFLRSVAIRLELACGGSSERALDSARAILASGTHQGPLYMIAAEALFRADQRELALEVVEQAVAFGGGRDARISRARMRSKSGDTLGAIEDLEQVVEEMIDLTPADVRLELARAYDAVGRVELARIHAQRALWTGGGEDAKQLLEKLGGP